jgi:ubiquinone/menaquinone biosynthesis C-methylase UbiE
MRPPPRRPAAPPPRKPRPARVDRPDDRGGAPDEGLHPAGWDNVADWYDKLVGEDGSDYHKEVILPAALRLLAPAKGERMLDVCCGQGVFARRLLEREPEHVLGIDASKRLIEAARTRGPRDRRLRYLVHDATQPGEFADGSFDGATCIMALQDLADPAGVFALMAAALRPGGRAVIIVNHPCFRVPRQSSWGWDESRKIQYRRVDRYATPLEVPITTHPGRGGQEQTVYYHRPIAAYLGALGTAGLAVTAAEELLTHREPPGGPRHRGLMRSHREFPLFLALKAVRLPA